MSRKPCEVSFGVDDERQIAVFEVEVPNDTERALEEYKVTLAALSTDDRLMYVDSIQMTNASNPPSIAIPPHSAIVVRFVLSSFSGNEKLLESWKDEAMKIGSVEADVYYAN